MPVPLPPPRPPPALRDMLVGEAGSGLVLMASAALALAVANSPLSYTYFAALKARVGPLSVLHWVNDALMAVFFLLVGLEIKREMLDRRLRTWPDRGAARSRGGRWHGGPGPRLRSRKLVLAADAARLGHPSRHRHRLRPRRAGAARPARARLA